MKPVVEKLRDQRGMTLIEVMVAVTVFAVVMIVALMMYDQTQRNYLNTDAATTQQQEVRFAMDRIVNTLRDAGASVNPTGENARADEQIEGAWESAVFVRGDFDNQRETPLEGTGAGQYSVVATGNDEIVGFIVTKADPALNTIPLTFNLDLTGTGGRRDAAVVDASATPPVIDNEETVTINVAASTLAEMTDPPYRVERVTFDAAGAVVREVIADNVFRMFFEYIDRDGVIVAPATLGGADTERGLRADLRRIGVHLVGMTDRPDPRLVDTRTFTPASPAAAVTAAQRFRKIELNERVDAVSLGKRGRSHGIVPAFAAPSPDWINACWGHCNRIVVNWAPVAGVTSYQIAILDVTAGTTATQLALDTNTDTYVPLIHNDTRQYRFQVAAWDQAGGTAGSFTPAVTVTTNHILPENTPLGPGAPVVAAPTGGAALTMDLSWTGVTQNQTALSNTCQTAGVGGLTSLLPPRDQELIDAARYEVHRVRDTGVTNPDFVTSAATRIDVTPPNISPLMTQAFVDRTASPCQPYYYKVQVADACNVTGADSPAMLASVSFSVGETPAAPTGLNTSTGVLGNMATPHDVSLAWNPVVTTFSGVPTGVSHYRITRQSRPASVPTFAPDAIIDVYEVTQYNDTPPAFIGVEPAFYEYTVAAVYDCPTPQVSVASAPFIFPCLTAGNASITAPPNGAQITDQVIPITVSVIDTWNSAEVVIRDGGGTEVGRLGPNSTTVTNGNYNFAWDSGALADGAYYIEATVTQGSCAIRTAVVQINLIPATGCLSLYSATSVPAAPIGDQPEFVNSNKSIRFKIMNSCEFAVTFTAMTPDWSSGPNPTSGIKKIKYDGNDVFDGGGGAPDNTRMNFNTGAAIVTIAAATRPGGILTPAISRFIEFEHNDVIWSASTNKRRWDSIILHVSSGGSGSVPNDEIGPVVGRP